VVAVVRSEVGPGLDPKGLEGGMRRVVERPVLAGVPVTWTLAGPFADDEVPFGDRPIEAEIVHRHGRHPDPGAPGGRCRPGACRPPLRHATGSNAGVR